MNRSSLAITLFLVLFACSSAAALKYEKLGFSIDALETPKDVRGHTPLMMTLPPVEGFSPNVNVQLQVFKESIEKYIELTKGQIKRMGAELVAFTTYPAEMRITWTTKQQGRDLRIYQRAIKSDELIYLITATCPLTQWDQFRSNLVSVVDSFQLNGLRSKETPAKIPKKSKK